MPGCSYPDASFGIFSGGTTAVSSVNLACANQSALTEQRPPLPGVQFSIARAFFPSRPRRRRRIGSPGNSHLSRIRAQR